MTWRTGIAMTTEMLVIAEVKAFGLQFFTMGCSY